MKRQIVDEYTYLDDICKPLFICESKWWDENIDFDNPKGFIYFISDGVFTKIGVATNVFDRFQTLQVGHVEELKILFVIPFSSDLSREIFVFEHWLHDKYNDYFVRGEWFELPTRFHCNVSEFQKMFMTEDELKEGTKS